MRRYSKPLIHQPAINPDVEWCKYRGLCYFHAMQFQLEEARKKRNKRMTIADEFEYDMQKSLQTN